MQLLITNAANRSAMTMGQVKSKIKRKVPLANSENPPNVEGHEISTPAAPRHLTRISELIDLQELLVHESELPDPPSSPGSPSSASFPLTAGPSSRLVQSPSGNMLSPQEYMNRPDRIMTLEERKQIIRSNTEKQIQMEEEAERESAAMRKRKKCRGSCLGFWCL